MTTALWGAATTGGRFTLTFLGTTVGDWVQVFRTTPKLATSVQVRHNFWATTTILDGSYPALSYEHTFVVYKEATDFKAFVQWFEQLDQLYNSSASTLQLLDQAFNVTSFGDFGTCYFTEGPMLKEPDNLLMFSAGLVELKFVGNTTPTLITTVGS